MTGYLGSKAASGAFQTIIAQMPPHDTYIETHLGSGVVMRRKPPAYARSIGIDIDPVTIATYGPIEGVEIHQGDCIAFLEAFDWASAGRVVLYADPPYLLSTRTSAWRYRHDYTVDDHLGLLALLKSLPANVRVMVSGYPSTLYDDQLAGWRAIEFQVSTRGGPRTERLWMNFPPGPVHWTEFAGVDFIDRQRIKRKAERWGKAFGKMNHVERLVILSAVLRAGAAAPQEPFEVEAAVEGRVTAARSRSRRI